MSDPKNKLYYGDNLEVLRDYIPDQSANLIYLDPLQLPPDSRLPPVRVRHRSNSMHCPIT
jgi:hypothetical protein